MLVGENSKKLAKLESDANMKLCMALLQANDEEQVEEILHDLIKDDDVWKPLGNISQNHSIVGSQAADSVSALVETIVNSEDAMLIGECKKRGINPKGENAPQSMPEAVEKFFGIKSDDIEKMKDREISKNIGIVASGSYDNPCIGCFDKGIGQNPDNFENTFLALPGTSDAPSKSEIPFVQGLFNMGGSGVLPFCGKRGKDFHFKLVISKRNPSIDDADGKWGFTIIRKRSPDKKHTSSTYVYLRPNNKILTISAKSLPILPVTGKNPKTYGNDLEYGSYIKLYNYRLGSRSKQVQLELLYEINRQLFKPALPFRIYETREYGSHTLDSAVTGLFVRLADNQSEIMEKGFPQQTRLNIQDVGELGITIYALKKEKRKSKYLGKHRVIFTLNGQRHYSKGEEFLVSEKVDKSYCAKDVLVIVNCDQIPDSAREAIFMPARDRSRDDVILDEVETELRDLLKHHPGLEELEKRRRDEELEEARKNKKPLASVVEKLVRNSKAFSKLFDIGFDVQRPYNFDYKVDRKNPYTGQFDPTFFRLRGETKVFEVPHKRSANIIIETDAQNDYFTRSKSKGKGPYLSPKSITWNYSLWNGVIRLHVKPNKKFKLHDQIRIQMVIKDKAREKPFEIEFKLKITKPIVNPPPNPDPYYHTPWRAFWRLVESKTRETKDFGKKVIETEGGEPQPTLALPEFIAVTKGDNQWKEFNFDDKTGVHIKKSGSNYDFYVNMSNEYYLAELNSAKPDEHKLIHDQYSYGLLLQCLAMIHEMKEKNPEEDISIILESVNIASRGIAMSVVPVIKGLNSSLSKK